LKLEVAKASSRLLRWPKGELKKTTNNEGISLDLSPENFLIINKNLKKR
jgi:hypothetical protein